MFLVFYAISIVGVTIGASLFDRPPSTGSFVWAAILAAGVSDRFVER